MVSLKRSDFECTEDAIGVGVDVSFAGNYSEEDISEDIGRESQKPRGEMKALEAISGEGIIIASSHLT
ncbi:hypothetical protein KFK09_020443 [Dendrobium nobile]|uniref:Uncharacterized protein n=1 Tax=Dendrobium nobile TaxID=94219 RepID=A0A8T3AML6_DENNO|nr:hypothetical protein KFK09_020443 [Dendrobium nobile]